MRIFLTFFLFCFALTSFAESFVTDVLGRQVVATPPAKRIVALAPHIVENLFSAGAGEYLVGVVDFSDFPLQAKGLPRVGSATHFSLETLLSLQPDLVVIWSSGRGGQHLAKLLSLGLRVYASDPVTLDDIAKEIRDYGILTGKVALAEKAVSQFQGELSELRVRYSGREKISTFYQVWNDPVQTVNGKHVISEVMELCGGRNIFSDALAIAPVISMEAILQRNPAVIVASGMDTARPEWLDAWKKWPQLKAVQQGNLYFIPPDNIQRNTLRMLTGSRLFCDYLQHARDKNLKADPAAPQNF